MSYGYEELDHGAFANPARGLKDYGTRSGWNNWGTSIDDDSMNAADALRFARLDWRVDMEPLCLADGAGGIVSVDNAFACCRQDLDRSDPRRVLGTATARYTTIQNTDAFAFLDMVCDSSGARIETCGSLHNGRSVWVLAQIPGGLSIGSNSDKVADYILVSTSHDGSKALRVDFVPIRVICANTLAWSIGAGDSRVSIRHSGNTRAKLADAATVCKAGATYFDGQHKLAQRLADTSLQSVADRFSLPIQGRALDGSPTGFIDRFLYTLLPDVVPEGKPRAGTALPRNATKRSEIVTLYNGGQIGSYNDGLKGTAYGLANAIGEYYDHHATVRQTAGRSEPEARFASTFSGKARADKQEAIDSLIACLDMADNPASAPSDDSGAIDDIIGSLQLA